MAKLSFGMMQSLDGYVDGPSGALELGPPDPILFRHFVDHTRDLDSLLCGRRMYEIMRYWERDRTEWSPDEYAFAQAWRSKPKWVASRTLTSVGPNAMIVRGDLPDVAQRLKSERTGDIDVSGPELAGMLSAESLIDEYRLYFRPVVLGSGKPYFAGSSVPQLRLLSSEAIGAQAIRLIYVPA